MVAWLAGIDTGGYRAGIDTGGYRAGATVVAWLAGIDTGGYRAGATLTVMTIMVNTMQSWAGVQRWLPCRAL